MNGQKALSGKGLFLLQSLKTPHGSIFYKEEWSSSHKNNRALLRDYLNSEYPTSDFLNLENNNPKRSISISHCKTLGGYFTSPNEKQYAGFDLEDLKRISKQTVQRISTPKELSLFNNIDTKGFKSIWPVKEAGFKALSSFIDVITDIEILSLHKLTDSNYLTGELTAKGKKGTFLAGSLNSNVIFASVLSDEE